MKALVFLNRIKINYLKEFFKAEDYFKRHGVDITFDFIQTDFQNPKPIVFPLNVGQRILLPEETADLVPTDPSYDFQIIMFNQEEFPVKMMPTGRRYTYKGMNVLHVGTHTLNPENLTYVEILHELMHGLVAKAQGAGFQVSDVMDTYFLNFFPELLHSNFGQQWNLLKPYIDTLTTVKWRHFRLEERTGSQGTVADLNPKLVDMLDEARHIAQIPFVITSGKRSKDFNDEVGGTDSSSHLGGLAVDIRARNSNEHFLITKGLIEAGFKRISKKYATHIHADIDTTKPQNILF